MGSSERVQAQSIHGQIDYRGGVKRKQLAEEQAADDRDAQGTAQLGAHAGSEGQWKRPEDG